MSGGALARIEQDRLLAILRPDADEDPVPRLAALAEAGVRCAEISLATEAGRAALPRAIEAADERLTIGAGTVRTVADAELALAAGARFLVAPGLDADVLELARGADVPCIPGVMTPTELDRALRLGAGLVKLFPAGRLGPAYVRDLLAPFPEARVVATGGIGAENASSFLEAGAVAVAVGSGLQSRDGIDRVTRAVGLTLEVS